MSSSSSDRSKYRPLYVGTLSTNPIAVMGQQYDPQYRTEEHKRVLKASQENGDSLYETFKKENEHAAKYPTQGSKSLLGDAGIQAHKVYGQLKNDTEPKKNQKNKNPSRGR